MPNHVRNILVFEGAEKRIEELRAFVQGANGSLDFNKLVPMPKTLDIPDSAGTNIGMLAAKYLRGVISPADFEKEARSWLLNDDGVESADDVLDALVRDGRCNVNAGEVALDNIHDHGFPTWYDWCVERWGTKWNAYDIEAEGGEIRFNTAWAAPLPVIERLAAKFPDIEIEHYWADEDVGSNCGHNSHWNGETSSEWLMDGDNEAFEIYVRCWGPSDCLEMDDGGNWQRNDCDTCAKCG
jgi:hypothetical protein